MENPLAELEAWWESAYDDGGMGTFLLDFRQRFQIQNDERTDMLSVEFETRDDAQASAQWRIEVSDCFEFMWKEGWGEPVWHKEHVLLTRDQSSAWISFSQPFRDPVRSLGAATRAHREIVGNWVPLDRYLRPLMFEKRFGQLANGPEKLVSAYASALEELGDDVSLIVTGGQLRERGAPDCETSVVTWGLSYFIACGFKLSRLP